MRMVVAMAATTLLIASLILAALSGVDAVSPSFPPASDCVDVSTTNGVLSDILPVVGLNNIVPARQCLRVTATPPALGGNAIVDLKLDLSGLDAAVKALTSASSSAVPWYGSYAIQWLVYNVNRVPGQSVRPQVIIGAPTGPGGVTAQAYAVVGSSGVITGYVVTQPGRGYTSPPTVTVQRSTYHAIFVSATAKAAISSTGQVTAVTIGTSTSGWGVGGPMWSSAFYSVNNLETFVQPTTLGVNNDPSIVINTGLVDMGNVKDVTQCAVACIDPTATGCACVPYGFRSNLIAFSSCNNPMNIHIELNAAQTFGVVAIIVPQNLYGVDHFPQLSYGKSLSFITPLGSQTTTIRVKANLSETIDPAKRWIQEMRVTLTTPVSETWHCSTSGLATTNTDCGVRSGQIASIAVDTSAYPTYNQATAQSGSGTAIVYPVISPATRGVASIQLNTQGSGYTSRPTVTITRATTSVVSGITIVDGGSGYTSVPTIVVGSGVASGWTVLTTGGVITSIVAGAQGSGFTSPQLVQVIPFTPIERVVMTAYGSGYTVGAAPGVVIGSTIGNAMCAPVVDPTGAISGCTITAQGANYANLGQYTIEFVPRLLTISFTCGTCVPGSGFSSQLPSDFFITWTSGSTLHSATPASSLVFAYTLSGSGVSTMTFVGVGGGLWTIPPTTIQLNSATSTAPAIGVVTSTTGSGASGYAVGVSKVTRAAILVATLSPPIASYPYPYVTPTPVAAGIRAVMTVEPCDGTASGSGQIASLEIDSPGSGYYTGDTITFTGGCFGVCVPATASVTFNPGVDATLSTTTISSVGLITGVTVSGGGSGYTSVPSVQFLIRRRVMNFVMVTPGFYTAAPTVTISGPDSTSPITGTSSQAYATATWNAVTGQVTGLTLVDPGSGYATATVSFAPLNELVSLRVCNNGSLYTSKPTVFITGGGGVGATADAIFDAGRGTITGITITNPGSGYTSYPTVSFIGGCVIPCSANFVSATVPTGSQFMTLGYTTSNTLAASATVIVEHGEGARAVATTTGGVVSGVTITRGGPTLSARDVFDLGLPTLSPSDGSAYIRQEIDTNGLPSTVTFRHPSTTSTLTTSATLTSRIQVQRTNGEYLVDPTMIKYKLVIGASTASSVLAADSITLGAPYASSIQPATKVWSWRDVPPQTGDYSFSLNFQSPATGAFRYFPTTEFGTNTVQGSAKIGAAFLQPTVKIEYFEYTNINGIFQSGTLRFGDTVRFQVNLASNQWSKINFTYNATGSGQEASTLQIRYSLFDGVNTPTWVPYVPTTGIRRKAAGATLVPEVTRPPVPLIIELSLGSCSSPTTTTFNFNVMARVWDFVDEGGECNTYLDCRAERGHPTPFARLDRSINGPLATRFRDCVVGGSGYTAYCVECSTPPAGTVMTGQSADCGCDIGQYCHLDNGLCTAPNGAIYTCDATSASKWGTCQAKDPNYLVLGAACIQNTAAAQILGTASDAYTNLGFCGASLYYNSTVDPAVWPRVNNTLRRNLWQGYCVNHLCQECYETDSMCAAHRICVDGAWAVRSGTSAQGVLARAATDTVQSEVYRNSQINASFLAFAIIITVLLAIGLAMYAKNAK